MLGTALCIGPAELVLDEDPAHCVERATSEGTCGSEIFPLLYEAQILNLS